MKSEVIVSSELAVKEAPSTIASYNLPAFALSTLSPLVVPSTIPPSEAAASKAEGFKR